MLKIYFASLEVHVQRMDLVQKRQAYHLHFRWESTKMKFCICFLILQKWKESNSSSKFCEPCLYAVATLQGVGLRDNNLAQAFTNMLRRKLTKGPKTYGSREVSTMLNNCGCGVSCSDERLLNNTWGKQATKQTNRKFPPGFVQCKSVHVVTLDNSYGRQQTIKSSYTTHYTNGMIVLNHIKTPELQEEPSALWIRWVRIWQLQKL